jgi:hypothetical protein
MSALRRRWTAFLLTVAGCVLPMGSAHAATSTDNSATAIIEVDQGRSFDFAWNLSRQRGDADVTNWNSATAKARCVACRATAIAFQIVLVSGSPTVVVPRNTAEAVNSSARPAPSRPRPANSFAWCRTPSASPAKGERSSPTSASA